MSSLGTKISLKEWVIIHLCYRDVFNAAVSIDELAVWLGLSIDNTSLGQVLNELLAEGLLETDNRGLYCLPGRMRLIFQRPIKQRLSQIMLLKTKYLKLLRYIPFVWYVGISGSVAANNPTMSLDGVEKGKADLDIFIVTAPYSFWLVNFFVRLLINLYPRKFHLICFNYSLDASRLQIENRNFFTATEIRNLKPVLNLYKTFDKFLVQNFWTHKYYPDLKPSSDYKEKKYSTYKVILPLNILFYLFFLISRCLKHLNFNPVLEMFRNNSVKQVMGLYKLTSGLGYEYEIKKKFSETIFKYFSDHIDNTLIQFLFPNYASETEKKINAESYKQWFQKYA